MKAPLVACLNGRVVPPAEAVIPITDEGLLRGDGAFEVVRVYGGRAFELGAHLDRIEHSADVLQLPVDRDVVEADCATALEAAGEVEAGLRIVLTRGGNRIVLIEPLNDYSEPTRLASITYGPSAILDGVKSLSYAANMLASRIARSRGADEALFVSADGLVLEAPTAAIFWLSGGRLRSPHLEIGILASITRRIIMEELEVSEGEFPLDDLLGADEAFIASTTREVQPVAAVDGVELPTVNGEQTGAAQAAVTAAIAAAGG